MRYIKELKEMLKNPKKKALAQLGLYAIFFIFVAILLRGADNRVVEIKEEPKTPIEFYEDMKSYHYKVTYTNIGKVDIIDGTYVDNASLFTFNNFKYYYEEDLYIIDNDSYYLSNIEYNITKIFNNNLKNIIEYLEEESKTKYKDGTMVTTYTIDSNELYNYLFDLESYYDNKCTITMTENESEIHNIVIDLTNLGLNLTKVEIEYSYLDMIEDLEFNIDNYTYKESL
jgi:hypothetical protein